MFSIYVSHKLLKNYEGKENKEAEINDNPKPPRFQKDLFMPAFLPSQTATHETPMTWRIGRTT